MASAAQGVRRSMRSVPCHETICASILSVASLHSGEFGVEYVFKNEFLFHLFSKRFSSLRKFAITVIASGPSAKSSKRRCPAMRPSRG